jgi:hypothetical protein
MLTRRHALIAFAGAVAPSFAAGPVRYTAASAPDALTKAVLSKPIERLTEGLLPGADYPGVVRLMFPQVIEQNFARLDGPGVAALMGALSSDELDALAQRYVTATGGLNGRLLDLLVLRLDGKTLASLAPHFGFAPLYEATWRTAPGKSQDYQRYADPTYEAPAPGDMSRLRLTPTRYVQGGMRKVWSYNLSVQMTAQEIYLEFRTAPLGSLGPAAAAYETMAYMSKHLFWAWGFGTAAGLATSWILQNYAPEVHMAIGQGVYTIVEAVHSTFVSGSVFQAGAAQGAAASQFQLGSAGSSIRYSGGDYFVAEEWMLSTKGGSGCRVPGCPVQE